MKYFTHHTKIIQRRFIEIYYHARNECHPDKCMDSFAKVQTCCCEGMSDDQLMDFYAERRSFWTMSQSEQSAYLIRVWESSYNIKEGTLNMLHRGWPLCKRCHINALGVSRGRYSRYYNEWQHSERTVKRVPSNHHKRIRKATKTTFFVSFLRQLGRVMIYSKLIHQLIITNSLYHINQIVFIGYRYTYRHKHYGIHSIMYRISAALIL